MIPDTLGPYRIERELGRGGMAVVYLAYHQRLERYVALKVLHEHLQHDANLVDRFLFEARAASRLEHKNIVVVYDAGRADGRDYIAMAYVEGESLADVLQRVDGPLSLDFTLSVLSQVAEALDYAHRRGIVHRDIKPSNILVRENGHVLLADFGIAHAASMGALTQTDSVWGTPQYMSPEQAAGHKVDGRSDVYSLGVVSYQILTGEKPFQSDTAPTTPYAYQQRNLPDPRDKNPALPATLAAVLSMATAQDPAQRYSTAGVFVRSLRSVLQPKRSPATPLRTKSSSRGWLLLLAGLLLGLAAIAFGAWALTRNQSQPISPSPTPPIVSEITTAPTSLVPPAIKSTATPTASPTVTPTSTATVTPPPTVTPTPSLTLTLIPTIALSPTPTSTPTPTPSPTTVPLARIAYVSDRTGGPQIYLINSDGTGDTQLTFEGRNEHPFWSDDGQVLFFSSDNGSGSALWSMHADGSEQTELLYAPGALSYSISPDSNHTAYAQLVDGEYDIFLDGEQWTQEPGNQTTYQWSPAGNAIVFENASGPQVIQLIGVGSSASTALTDASYNSWNPTWAPDASHLAFASTRDGNAGIYTISIAGGDLLRLTPLDAWSQAPSWSPDGSAIAHIAGGPEGGWSIYVMQAGGGGRAHLLSSIHPEAPGVWSPDSQQLAVITNDGDQELTLINRDGSGFRQLTNNAANEWGAVWEP